MSNCFVKPPKKNRVKQLLGSGLPDIPSAPVYRKRIRNVDYDFQERKLRYQKFIPIYTADEIDRLELPYHELIMKRLQESGYNSVVNELDAILNQEDKVILECHLKDPLFKNLTSQPEVFKQLAETLKFCQDLHDMEKPEHALNLRKELGIKMLKYGLGWLTRHLLGTLLASCEFYGEQFPRIKAESHCVLAYLAATECHAKESPIEESLLHLTRCRELSDRQPWNFRPGTLAISIKKPIYLHGYRDEEKVIDGSSMHLYNIASLLEYVMLINLVNQLLSGEFVTEKDVALAVQYADDALQLAMEIHVAEAMTSALIRFANVLQSVEAYEEAMDYYDQLHVIGEMNGDPEAEAMGFHGLGCCFKGKGDPTSAMEMFATQREVASGVPDLESEALQEMGTTLVAEGQTLEGKECLRLAELKLHEKRVEYGTPEQVVDDSWAQSGVCHGMDLWGRYAGLTRRLNPRDVQGIIDFKNRRTPLPKVRRPDYGPESVPQVETWTKGFGGPLLPASELEHKARLRAYSVNRNLAEVEKQARLMKKPWVALRAMAAVAAVSSTTPRKSVAFAADLVNARAAKRRESDSEEGDEEELEPFEDASLVYASDALWKDVDLSEEFSLQAPGFKVRSTRTINPRFSGTARGILGAIKSINLLMRMPTSSKHLGPMSLTSTTSLIGGVQDGSSDKASSGVSFK